MCVKCKYSDKEEDMAAVKGNQVKAILKKKGFDTKYIRVTTERSFINVKISDLSISIDSVKSALSDLHTVKNVSKDLDPMYEGDVVIVEYDYKAAESMKKEIIEKCSQDKVNKKEFEQRIIIGFVK
jgi:plastocyanin domain-containing protein